MNKAHVLSLFTPDAFTFFFFGCCQIIFHSVSYYFFVPVFVLSSSFLFCHFFSVIYFPSNEATAQNKHTNKAHVLSLFTPDAFTFFFLAVVKLFPYYFLRSFFFVSLLSFFLRYLLPDFVFNVSS